jgi:hypothetical protein
MSRTDQTRGHSTKIKYKKETADRIWGNTALRTGWLTYGMICHKN